MLLILYWVFVNNNILMFYKIMSLFLMELKINVKLKK